MVLLGETIPNFTADSTEGCIDFHKWLGDTWGILFSHPYDFTPICTTELARAAELMPKFKRLGVKVIGVSCDSIQSHKEWIKDIKCYGNMNEEGFPYPIINDESRKLSQLLGMLDLTELDQNQKPLTARTVFIVDPKKILRLSISYPVTVGRNFDEIIRGIESLQLFDKHLLGTPADWKVGEDCIIHPALSHDKAEELYGDTIKVENLPSGKHYLRTVPYPQDSSSSSSSSPLSHFMWGRDSM